MKALVIVDIQNDFLPGGSLSVDFGDEIIDLINGIQSRYNIVVATQDWHPLDHQSFASNHVDGVVFTTTLVNGIDQVLWPDHCVQGSYGAELSSKLKQHHIQAVFRKGMDIRVDSYSGFFDNGRLRSTGLDGFLKEQGVREVHICGLAADFCVFYTAMDALELGYKTAIVSKGTKPIDKDMYRNKKELFIQQGGTFV